VKDGIFISHIGEEKHIAARIKQLLRESFGSDVRIFVSSDYESIRSGSDWQNEIIAALKSSRVVLILCSADSVTRPWINYEAGVGDGTDWEAREVGRTSVFPLVVRNFPKGKLPLPLSRKHVRDAHDVDDMKALLRHISEDIGIVASPVNVEKFVGDMQEATKRIQARHERLALTDAEFELYVKDLISTENENEFLVLIEDLREQTVDIWGGEWPDSPEGLADHVLRDQATFSPGHSKVDLSRHLDHQILAPSLAYEGVVLP
jgi:hypothetical protein